MGNPFSGEIASLFQEYLERGSFKYSLPSNTTYFRYFADILIFLPQNVKIEELKEKLNNVETSTDEKESNNTLHFLDIQIIKSHYNLSFKVYRKLTTKNDYIHFYFHLNKKIRTGLIIGFYQRALKTCRPQYLNEEVKYIEHSLKILKCPKIFILNVRKKLLRSNKPKKNNPTIHRTHRPISLPTNNHNISPTPSRYFFPISSLKLFPLSPNLNFLMKPDTFDFKPFLFFLSYIYPLHHLIIFLICV